MAERSTAEAQLARILDLIPRAAREGGASLSELCAALGADERSILRDLEEVYTRAYYHPAGSGEDVQILIESDQVALWTAGEFRRPPRLNPKEALALGLGLRILAADSPQPARAGMLALAETLEERLSSRSPEEMRPHFSLNGGDASPEGHRATVSAAARERRRCRIEYLKAGAPEPEVREVDPYAVLLADVRWYLVAHCHRSDGVRVFRVDRMTGVEMLDAGFEVPAEFDASAYVDGGRVYRSEDDVEVRVRYSPRIARWIEEQGPVERREDGSVLVRYRVADRQWLVKHVLQHGPDAEVEGPPEMRQRVREALQRILARISPSEGSVRM